MIKVYNIKKIRPKYSKKRILTMVINIIYTPIIMSIIKTPK